MGGVELKGTVRARRQESRGLSKGLELGVRENGSEAMEGVGVGVEKFGGGGRV